VPCRAACILIITPRLNANGNSGAGPGQTRTSATDRGPSIESRALESASRAENTPEQAMKFLFDFFPVILFFVAYKLQGIYAATVVAIGASALQVAWVRLRHGRIERMHLVTLGLLLLFGGMTLALRDPTFVMWKPSIVNWLFALVFLGGHFIGDKPLVQRLMGHAVTVPAAVWRRLNLAWVTFFVVSGLVNVYVVYIGSGFYEAKEALIAASGEPEVDLAACAAQFTGSVLGLCEHAHAAESSWVDFKLFGMMGMTLVFVLGQAFYLARHIEPQPETQPAVPPAGDAAQEADAASR
jgi:intracellular septation protein